MKTLIIGNSESVYVRDFVENMQRKTCGTFDVLSWNKGRLIPNENVREISISLPRWLKNVRKVRGVWKLGQYLRALKKLDKYDICHIHLVGKEAVLVAKIAREKCDRMISTVWGGEFYKTSDGFKRKQMRVYDRSDRITFATEEVRDAFVRYYPMYENRTRICTFGLATLDFLKNVTASKEDCKEHFGIPKDAISVCVGYNAGPWHRHKEIIKSIASSRLLKESKTNLFLILPMTYGGHSKYIGEVERELFGMKNVVITRFLSPSESAMLRKATDIFINVQTTDVLSGSMLEHLYAGSVVITGSWLPYKILDEMKILLFKVDKVDEVGSKIFSILPHINLLKSLNRGNAEKIYRLASWEHNIGSWKALYEEVTNDA